MAGADGVSHEMALLMTPLVRLGQLDSRPGLDAASVVASNGGRTSERITLSSSASRRRADGRRHGRVGDRIRIRDLRVVGRAEARCSGLEKATVTRSWRAAAVWTGR